MISEGALVCVEHLQDPPPLVDKGVKCDMSPGMNEKMTGIAPNALVLAKGIHLVEGMDGALMPAN